MKKPLEWKLNSLAASDTTKWVPVPKQCKRICIAMGWPATGSPIGTLAIEVSNHGTEGTSGAAYSPAPSTNPSGAVAANIILDNIVTSACYIRMTYTASSGGTACVFTNDSGVAGTSPTIEFKE
jgi:hypothetical protein